MVFGDIFRQRGDYTKGNGIFQQENGAKVCPHNPQIIRNGTIIKPEETDKKVTRNGSSDNNTATETQHLEEKQGETNNKVAERNFSNILKFNMKRQDQQEYRKTKKVPKTIVIEHDQDLWNLEEHGGVKMWVNGRTAEVSVEDPHRKEVSRRRVPGNDTSVNSYRAAPWKVAGPGKNSIRQGGNRRGSIRDPILHSIRQTNFQNEDMKEWFDFLDSNSSAKIMKAITK